MHHVFVSEKWNGAAAAKAERLIDPDVMVDIQGTWVRLGDVPVYGPCLSVWLQGKGHEVTFGWSSFIGFARDIAAAAPEDLERVRLFMRDPYKPLVLENLEWRKLLP